MDLDIRLLDDGLKVREDMKVIISPLSQPQRLQIHLSNFWSH